jgi:hypothetical protein
MRKSENESLVEALSLGFVVPRTKQFSPKVKELFDAGFIKAQQIEDWETGEQIWVCEGLSDSAKNALYHERATAANAAIQAQLRMVLPQVPESGSPEIRHKIEKIRRDLEKAIKDIKLY